MVVWWHPQQGLEGGTNLDNTVFMDLDRPHLFMSHESVQEIWTLDSGRMECEGSKGSKDSLLIAGGLTDLRLGTHTGDGDWTLRLSSHLFTRPTLFVEHTEWSKYVTI